MKFMAHTVLNNEPDPDGHIPHPADRLHELIEHAVKLEDMGFDGFGVGERHVAPDIGSSPATVLAYLAARTTRMRLMTAVTVLSLLDPVRVAEDYATIDNLSRGRVDLIIGKGTRGGQADLFGIDLDEKWTLLREKYELLRRLWREENITWSGTVRTPLRNVTIQPRPFQRPPRIWHGSASSTESTELAAKWGDPLFSANAMKPVQVYVDLVNHYRQRLTEYGHAPETARVGMGVAGLVIADRSQDAIAAYRPSWEHGMRRWVTDGFAFPFDSLEDFIARGSLLVGSPQFIVERILQLHELFGNELLNVGSAGEGLPPKIRNRSLELFAEKVMPAVRAAVPSRLWEPQDLGTP
jgi:alkanesulfonate monooxygenase SsuD/methylene tetrahydromethanopterin reductase-like flavin-dependent oxidoreductase (luciferase family)